MTIVKTGKITETAIVPSLLRPPFPVLFSVSECPCVGDEAFDGSKVGTVKIFVFVDAVEVLVFV